MSEDSRVLINMILTLAGLVLVAAYNQILLRNQSKQLTEHVDNQVKPAAEQAKLAAEKTESKVLTLVESHREENKALLNIINDLRNERKEVVGRLTDVEALASNQGQRIKTYESELNNLLEDNKKKTEASQERDRRIESQRHDIEHLGQQAKEMLEMLSDAKKSLDAKEQELIEARIALNEARSDLEKARAELKKAYEALADAERRAATATAQLEVERNKVSELQDKVAGQQKHIEELEKRVLELQAQIDEQKAKIQAVEPPKGTEDGESPPVVG